MFLSRKGQLAEWMVGLCMSSAFFIIWQLTQKLKWQESDTEVLNFGQRVGPFLYAHKIVATH